MQATRRFRIEAMLKVLIADDHPIIRRGLKQILEETSEMGVFGEASTGERGFRHGSDEGVGRNRV